MAEPVEGEDAFIQTVFAPLAAGAPGALGLRDDCAVLSPPPGCDLVLKTDPVRSGVHFFADDAPEDIGWKALAVNVSDLAAKGAEPLGYLLAASFPALPDRAWAKRFADGLEAAQAAFGCPLYGGDTDRAEGPMSFALTVFGAVPAGRMIRRATARAGDAIFLSGTMGDAALGLEVRRGGFATATAEHRAHVLARYLRPQPRLGSRAVLREAATAAMDVSDGLVKDLARLCRASGVGAAVEVDAVPLSSAALALTAGDPARRRALFTHGDDYEVLFTAPPSAADRIFAGAARADIPVTRIGTIVPGPGVTWTEDGREIVWTRTGYDHFDTPGQPAG
jgi:thiamine-monophosphate kinase